MLVPSYSDYIGEGLLPNTSVITIQLLHLNWRSHGSGGIYIISGFFHVNKVLSVLSKLPPGVCWRGGGGGGGATGLLNKGGGGATGFSV